MGIVSYIKNWTNKISGSYKENRSLRFESLEQRQMLSVSPLEMPFYAEDTAAFVGPQLQAYSVDLAGADLAAFDTVVFAAMNNVVESNINPTPIAISSLNDINTQITAATSAGYTGITLKLTGAASVFTFSADMTIDASGLTDGLILDLNGKTLVVANGAEVSIHGVDFTSSVGYTLTEGSVTLTVLSNAGTLELSDCTFHGFSTSQNYAYNGTLKTDFRILQNTGDLTADRLLIYQNTSEVRNTHNGAGGGTARDANAWLYAIYNDSASSCTLSNVLTHNNIPTATAKNGNTSLEDWAVYSNRALNIYNATLVGTVEILRPASGEGSDAVSNIYNTLYTRKVTLGNLCPWATTDSNLEASAATMASIFQYYNNGTFLNAGQRDYTIKDTAIIIDAGDSSHINGTAKDVLGNARISGQKVDIGAIEYIIFVEKTQYDAPTNVHAVPGGDMNSLSTLILTWDVMSDAEAYEVRYDLGGGWITADANDFEIGLDTVTFTLAGLNAGQTVYFQVRSTGDELTDSEWVQVSTTTKTQLAALTGLTATATGTDAVQLTWNATAGYAGDILLEYKAYGDSTWSSTTITAAEYAVAAGKGTLNITGLDEYTAYSFRVTAASLEDDVLSSAVSGTANATTFFQLRDLAFIGTPGVGTTSVTVYLADDAENAGYVGQYVLQYSTDSTFSTFQTATVNTDTLSATATGLAQGTAYYFRAAAVNNDETLILNSGWVQTSATTKTQLAALTDLTANANGSTDTITLTWNAASFTGSVQLESRLSGTNDWVTGATLILGTNYTVTSGVATATITGLSEYTAYDFRVTALGNGDTVLSSAASGVASASTVFQLRDPAFSAAAAVGTDTITIYFADNAQNLDYVSEFVVQYSTDSTFGTYATAVVDTLTMSASATDLTQGATYYFRVMAAGDDVLILDSDWVTTDAMTTFINLDDFELTGLRVVGVNNENTLEVTWDELPEMLNFTVEYSLNGKTWSTVGVERTDNGALITGLFAYTNYQIRITATAAPDSGYLGSLDAETNGTTLVLLAAPRFDFTTVSRTASSITMTLVDIYNYSGTVGGYLVQYVTDLGAGHESVWADAGYAVFDTITGTITGLQSDTAYYFRVMAVGLEHVSLDSNWAYNTRDKAITLIKLDAPANLTVTRPDGMPSTYSQIVSWDAVTGATSYALEYCASTVPFTSADNIPAEAWYTIGTTTGTSVNVEGLDSGLYYLYRVKAMGDTTTHEESEWATLETAVRTRIQLKAPDDMFAFSANLREMEFYININKLLADGMTIRYRVVDKATNEPLGDGTWTEIPFSELAPKIVADKTAYYLYYGLPPGTRFEFEALVYSNSDDYLESVWSKSFFANTKEQLATPVELTVSNKAVNGFKVSWEAVPNATGYLVEYVAAGADQIDGNTVWTTVTANTANTFIILTGLDEATTYTVRVKALGNANNVYASEFAMIDATTLTQLVLADTATAAPYFASEFDTDKIRVTWSAVDNATGYTVKCYDAAGNFVADYAMEAGVTEQIFVGLHAGTEYRFEIVALGDGEIYGDSVIREATAVTATAVAQTTITIQQRAAQSLSVSWTEVTGATGYRIACVAAGQTEITYVDVEADGRLEYVFTGLTPDTAYTIIVIATGNEAAALASSQTESLTSTLIKLSDKATVDAASAATSSSSITLIINDPNLAANIGGYSLQYYKTSDARATTTLENLSYVITTDGQRITIQLTGLTPATTYAFKLNVLGVENVSEGTGFFILGNTQIATWALLAVPTGLEGTATAPDTVTLTWNPVSGAAGYAMQYRVVGSDTWLNVPASMVDNCTATVTGLSNFTDYEFQVMAVGVNGVSESSAYSTPAVVAEIFMPYPLDTVLDVDAVADDSWDITVTWTPVDNVTDGDITYTVVIMQGDTVIRTYTGLTGNSLNVDGLAPKTTYTVTVTANPTDPHYADSAVSDAVDVTTPAIPIGISRLSAHLVEEQIVFNWTSVPDAEGYILKYFTADDAELKTLGTFSAMQNSFIWDDWAYGTEYTFILVAFGPEATHGTSESDPVLLTTPVEITLAGVIRKNASNFADTTMPATEIWVDEWSTLYFEIWTSVTEGVVDGRKLTFTIGVDSSLFIVSPPTMPEGISLTESGGVWTLIIGPDYVSTGGDATMLAQFKLTPVTNGGLAWEDMYVEDAFALNGTIIATDVYAIPYDTNDDGIIDTRDYGKFAEYYDYNRYHPFADFNGDGHLTNEDDWAWVMLNNRGTYFGGEKQVVFYNGFPFDFIKTWTGELLRSPVVIMGSADLETPTTPVFTSLVTGSYTPITFVQNTASVYLGTLPVLNSANALSDNAATRDRADDQDGLAAELINVHEVLAVFISETVFEENVEEMM